MPLQDDNHAAEHLLLDPNFHLAFLKKYGELTWHNFVSGGHIFLPKDNVLGSMFIEKTTTNEEFAYKQDVLSWEVPDFEEPAKSKMSMHAQLVLAKGNDLSEFIEKFRYHFKKYDIKSLISTVEGETDHDWGYEQFPGIKEFQSEAADYLNSFLVKKGDRSPVYNMYLATGYNEEDDLESFVHWLINENESSIGKEVLNALTDGLRDSFVDSANFEYRRRIENSIREHTFPRAQLNFSKKDDSWSVTTTLQDILDIALENTLDSQGRLNYTHVSEATFLIALYGDAADKESQVSISDEYSYPKNIDWDYGYEYFKDQFPKELLTGSIL